MPAISFDESVNLERIHQLAELIANREVVFFTGAALSFRPPSNLPSAYDLKTAVLRSIVSSLGVSDESLQLPSARKVEQKLEDLPMELMFSFIYSILGDRAADAFALLESDRFNSNHLFLARGAGQYFSTVLTANFDHLIEDAIKSLGKTPTVWATEDKLAKVRGTQDLGPISVVKFHGTLGEAKSLIATMDQAGEELTPRRATLLAQCLTKYHVCFVGYGAADYDISATLDRASARPIFALLRPPASSNPIGQFFERNRPLLDLLEAKSGTPIIYDIDRFFDVLCTRFFPSNCEPSSAPSDETQTRVVRNELTSKLQPWASRISQYEAHSILGLLYYHMGEGDISALVFHTAQRSAVHQNRQEELRLLVGEARALSRESGSYERAHAVTGRALRIAEEINSLPDIAECLFLSGDLERMRTDSLSLKAWYRLWKAEHIFASLPDPVSRRGRGAAMLSLSLVYQRICPAWLLFRPIRTRILGQAQTAYHLLKGPNGNALGIIAELYGDLHEYRKAQELGRQAERICRWHHDWVGLANTMRRMGSLHLRMKQFDMAKTDYLTALSASRRAPDQPGIIKALVNLADLSTQSGKYARALQLYRSAWRTIQKMKVGNVAIGLRMRTIWGQLFCQCMLIVASVIRR